MSGLFAATRREVPLLDADPLVLWPEWVDAIRPDGHDRLLAWLIDNLPWQQRTVKIEQVREPVVLPRLECWFAENDGVEYAYNGNVYVSHWMDAYGLHKVRAEVEEATGVSGFNAVFANLYRDGRDSIGEHDDGKEDVFGPAEDMLIASLSLGARRPFRLRSKRTEPRAGKNYAVDIQTVELGEGDLLLMGRRTQSEYLHGVPKVTKGEVGPRLNLTFRRLRPPGPREPRRRGA